jgi:hypothetical protein
MSNIFFHHSLAKTFLLNIFKKINEFFILYQPIDEKLQILILENSNILMLPKDKMCPSCMAEKF